MLLKLSASAILMYAVWSEHKNLANPWWHYALILGVVSSIAFILTGANSLFVISSSAVLAALIFTPFVLIKACDKNELAPFIAFGAMAGWMASFFVVFIALLIALVWGFYQLSNLGKANLFFSNLKQISTFKKPQAIALHQISFRIPLMFAWILQLLTWQVV